MIAKLFTALIGAVLLLAVFIGAIKASDRLIQKEHNPILVQVAEPEEKEPSSSLQDAKRQLIEYYDSGHYFEDVENALKPAVMFVEERVKDQTADENLAVVFDVDETALSNWLYMKESLLATDLQYWKMNQAYQSWFSGDSDEPIDPTLEFYRYLLENGIAIFFVSSRAENLREATEGNLYRAGYEKWTELYLRPVTDTHPTEQSLKTDWRKQIQDLGYSIILTVGDQPADLDGGYSESVVKIPNPFY